jgi:hypothetical protein
MKAPVIFSIHIYFCIRWIYDNIYYIKMSRNKTTSIHWPWGCTVYVDIHFWDSVWWFWMEANLWKMFIVCLYLYLYCRWRANSQRGEKGGGGVPLIGLISAHFGECPGFLTLWLFLVLNACFEVRDSCFDFDGIVDHNSVCLNFLFIKLLR